MPHVLYKYWKSNVYNRDRDRDRDRDLLHLLQWRVTNVPLKVSWSEQYQSSVN